jgi:hypothetical protein
MNCIAEEALDAGLLMFVNEAAKDEHTVSWKYGRSAKGARCVVQRRFVKGMQYSIIPVITLDGIITYDIVDGPVDSEHFVKFVKDHVVLTSSCFIAPLITNLIRYRCHSQTLIQVLIVCLSWITAASIMVNKSIGWLKMNIASVVHELRISTLIYLL